MFFLFPLIDVNTNAMSPVFTQRFLSNESVCNNYKLFYCNIVLNPLTTREPS